MPFSVQDSLLLISDLHFWELVWNPLRLCNKRLLGNANLFLRRRHELHTEQAAAYAEKLAELGVATLIASGDFTSTATEREYKAARAFLIDLASRGLLVHTLPGNHDVYTFESVRKQRFDRYIGGFCPAAQLPCRLQLPGGTPLVMAPTVRPNWLSSRGHISKEAIAATATLVREAPPGPVLLVSHYPLLHHTHAYHSAASRRLQGASALKAALGKTGRQVLCLAGHVHRCSYSFDSDYENLQHVTAPALFYAKASLKRPGGFLRIEVAKDTFRVRHYWRQAQWDSRECAPQWPPEAG